MPQLILPKVTLTTHLALLRAVNVGGSGKVAMADLRVCLVALGFTGVRTVLQTGNVVFAAEGPGGPKLEQLLERELQKRLRLHTEVMVRSASEWADVVSGNPFVEEAERDPSHLLAMMTRQPVAPKALAALRSAVARTGGRETVGASDGQVYLFFPDGIGRSRVTSAVVERALGCPVTGRNWNTVLKLAQALTEASA